MFSGVESLNLMKRNRSRDNNNVSKTIGADMRVHRVPRAATPNHDGQSARIERHSKSGPWFWRAFTNANAARHSLDLSGVSRARGFSISTGPRSPAPKTHKRRIVAAAACTCQHVYTAERNFTERLTYRAVRVEQGSPGCSRRRNVETRASRSRVDR